MILNFFERNNDLFEESSNDRICDVYMISDSSGETASVVLRAVAAQLVGVRIEGHLYPLVKSYQQIDEVLNHDLSTLWSLTHKDSGISEKFYYEYFANKDQGFAIKIKKTRKC